MRQRRVLVVEDDEPIRRGIADALSFEGYTVLEAADGRDGMAAALGADYDLLLLDLVLPGCDGLEVLRAVRERRPGVPVIILTARGAESDRVRGLRLGSDDYVVKPFSVRELLARVEAVLRRVPTTGEAPELLELPGVTADLRAACLRFGDDATTPLTDREVALLRYLARNPGRVISRDELLVRVWGINAPGIETRTIDAHVARLREKLRDAPDRPRILATERGKGYRFLAGGPPP